MNEGTGWEAHLTDQDRAIVDGTCKDLTDADRAQIIEIHKEGIRRAKEKLAGDRLQVEAQQRVIAMRSYALSLSPLRPHRERVLHDVQARLGRARAFLAFSCGTPQGDAGMSANVEHPAGLTVERVAVHAWAWDHLAIAHDELDAMWSALAEDDRRWWRGLAQAVLDFMAAEQMAALGWERVASIVGSDGYQSVEWIRVPASGE